MVHATAACATRTSSIPVKRIYFGRSGSSCFSYTRLSCKPRLGIGYTIYSKVRLGCHESELAAARTCTETTHRHSTLECGVVSASAERPPRQDHTCKTQNIVYTIKPSLNSSLLVHADAHLNYRILRARIILSSAQQDACFTLPSAPTVHTQRDRAPDGPV